MQLREAISTITANWIRGGGIDGYPGSHSVNSGTVDVRVLHWDLDLIVLSYNRRRFSQLPPRPEETYGHAQLILSN